MNADQDPHHTAITVPYLPNCSILQSLVEKLEKEAQLMRDEENAKLEMRKESQEAELLCPPSQDDLFQVRTFILIPQASVALIFEKKFISKFCGQNWDIRYVRFTYFLDTCVVIALDPCRNQCCGSGYVFYGSRSR